MLASDQIDTECTYHQPLVEQQLPKVEPVQVWPVVPPHEPSVEALRVDEAAAPEDVPVAVPDEEPVHVPKADWQPVPQ